MKIPIQSNNSPKVSIVIRAYNEEKHIGRLLDGIQQQNYSDYEIILVDSGSTDNTVTIAAQRFTQNPTAGHQFSVVHIPPEQFTFGRSLNLGIEQARGEFIVIASAHVYPVYPDWLESLLKPFSDPQVALVYGKQRGWPGANFSEHQIFAHWFPEQSQLRQGYPFCNNANAAIRRSLWQARRYDETLTGLEDLDWARWAMEQGHAIAYAAEAEIIHVHNETPQGVYNRYRREAMAFKSIFPHETFGVWDFLRLGCANIANDLVNFLRATWKPGHPGDKPTREPGNFWSNLWSIFWFRWMQFWGTYQGYRHPGPVTSQLRRTFYYPHPPSDKNHRQIEPIRYQQ